MIEADEKAMRAKLVADAAHSSAMSSLQTSASVSSILELARSLQRQHDRTGRGRAAHPHDEVRDHAGRRGPALTVE